MADIRADIRRFTIPASAQKSTGVLEVYLIPSRSDLTGRARAFRVTDDDVTNPVDVVGTSTFADPIRITLDDVAGLDHPLILEVEYSGEPLAILGVVSAGFDIEFVDDERERIHPFDWFERRVQEVESTFSGFDQRVRLFFLELDRHTLPFDDMPFSVKTMSRKEYSFRKHIVKSTARLLKARAWERFHGRMESLRDRTCYPWFTAYLSRLQLSLYSKYFGSPLNTGEIWNAFQSFASGALRMSPAPDDDDTSSHDDRAAGPQQFSDTEPQSAYLFLFAEFSFLAMQQNIDAEAWSTIVGAQVAAQPTYAEAYAPDVPRSGSTLRTFDSYRILKKLKPTTARPMMRIPGSSWEEMARNNLCSAIDHWHVI